VLLHLDQERDPINLAIAHTTRVWQEKNRFGPEGKEMLEYWDAARLSQMPADDGGRRRRVWVLRHPRGWTSAPSRTWARRPSIPSGNAGRLRHPLPAAPIAERLSRSRHCASTFPWPRPAGTVEAETQSATILEVVPGFVELEVAVPA
jgi:hypothetical protein